MRDNCPYCKKNYCIPEVAFINAESYGSNGFTIQCNHCGKILDIYITRTTQLQGVVKSDKKQDECSW